MESGKFSLDDTQSGSTSHEEDGGPSCSNAGSEIDASGDCRHHAGRTRGSLSSFGASSDYFGGGISTRSDEVAVGSRKARRRDKWFPEEDKLLREVVSKLGPKQWNRVSDMIPTHSPKSCRLRWFNQIDPSICTVSVCSVCLLAIAKSDDDIARPQ